MQNVVGVPTSDPLSFEPMKGVFLLTWRYLCFHRLRTGILLVCLALTFLLPLYLQIFIRQYEESLTRRADETPLLLGTRGNEYELVLRQLYFTLPEGKTNAINQRVYQDAVAKRRGLVIPLHTGYSAQKRAIVGTSLEYFEFRGLRTTEGSLPLRLGDAVLGANVARDLDLKPGDFLLSDQTSLYNIAAEQPLKLRVTGILGESRSPDDDVVFTDVKTVWIIAGIGHGHDDLADPANQDKLLSKDEQNVVGSAAVVQYREITDENIGSFHFHGLPTAFPLSALIVVPDDAKSATLLKGAYDLSDELQLVEPRLVVADLLGIIFKVKRFFDGSFLLVTLITALFLALVIMLTLKLRARERDTLYRMGCARSMVLQMQLCELGFLLLTGLGLAVLLAWLMFEATRHLVVF